MNLNIVTVILLFLHNLFFSSSVNLIQDYSFESINDSFPSPWIFQFQSGAAGAISQDRAATNGAYSAKIAILGVGTKSYYVQLQQKKIALHTNQSYKISFDAKADSTRVISLALQNGSPPYLGYTNRTFLLTPHWHTYTFIFTALQADPNALLNFNLGQTTGNVWVDNVKMVSVRTPQTSIPVAIAGNVLQNNSFEDTQNEFPYLWVFQTQNNAVASVLLDDTDAYDGGFSAKTIIETVGEHDYDVQLTQNHIHLANGKNYTIKLSAKATSPRFFSVTVQQTASPYTIYSSHIFLANTSWNTDSYFFTSPTDDTNAKISLNVGRTVGTMWLDGVSLVAGDPLPLPKYTQKRPSAIYTGVALDGTPGDLTVLNQFDADASKSASIYEIYQHWGETEKTRMFQTSWMDTIRKHGAIPMITWEPWVRGGGAVQPEYSLKNIINGKFDPYITKFAQSARMWGHPFFFRFAHEMNTDTYPWSELVNRNSPGEYIQAWRHVYDIFASEGVTNATWVWSPYREVDGTIPLAELYPGDAYVQWVGIDGYNWGDERNHSWTSFSSLFQQTYSDLLTLTHKPIMIAEIGSNDQKGSKADWITDTYTTQIPQMFPGIKAVVWFNYNKEHDWRIESSPTVQSAFVTAMQSSYYLHNTFSNLNSTPIPDPSIVDLTRY